MHLSKEDIENIPRIKRLNLINSVSGIKPANVVGTKSKEGIPNLSIVSSVVHLGSNPAYLGFILRPSEEVRRDTYENILETGVFTINHIHAEFVERAHYTSAKFDHKVSEFEPCGLSEEYQAEFSAPFVGESKLKMGLKHVDSLPIKVNNTLMIIGEIQHLIIPEESMDERGYLNLGLIQDVGISGLNSYYEITKIHEFPYARPDEVPDFKN